MCAADRGDGRCARLPHDIGQLGIEDVQHRFDSRLAKRRQAPGLRPADANGTPSIGNFDVYVSRRSSTRKPWSPPVNLGRAVNSPGSETRATLSWDGRRLYFGRDVDIYSSTRRAVPHWQ